MLLFVLQEMQQYRATERMLCLMFGKFLIRFRSSLREFAMVLGYTACLIVWPNTFCTSNLQVLVGWSHRKTSEGCCCNWHWWQLLGASVCAHCTSNRLKNYFFLLYIHIYCYSPLSRVVSKVSHSISSFEYDHLLSLDSFNWFLLLVFNMSL